MDCFNQYAERYSSEYIPTPLPVTASTLIVEMGPGSGTK